MTLLSQLDYEQLQQTQFTVDAKDNGSPPLTNQATVVVTVINVNDNDPAFLQVGVVNVFKQIHVYLFHHIGLYLKRSLF